MRLRPFRNPLLLLNRAAHRVFQSVRSDTLAYSPGSMGPCFEIVSVEVGNVSPERFVVCFNAPADDSCQDAQGFVPVLVNGGQNPFDNRSAHPSSTGNPNCIEINADNGPSNPSTGPADNAFIAYIHIGEIETCHKLGTTGDSDCELAEVLPPIPVTNNVYGPDTVRIGDVSDDLIIATFPTPLATAGSDWEVEVNAVPKTSIPTVVGGALHLQILDPVISTDVVTISHVSTPPWADAAVAVDGRICWRFFKMPVLNVVGVGFWNREDAGPWLLEPKTGRWRLEGG